MSSQEIYNLPLTQRLDANLGYRCNNDCLFCYFRNRKHSYPNLSSQQAKKLLSFIRRLGIDTLEITGGEPTIRDDIFELISFAKKSLRFKKISIITNGSRLCDEEFTIRAVECGLDDVLLSIHGHDAALHDRLAGRKGAFEAAVKTIRNVIKLGVSCRTNTVVTKLNYEEIENIAKLVYDLGVQKVNYIYFSPLDDARYINRELWPKYSESAPFIKEMIERYKDKFKTISIKVIPFCFLEGYETYLTNFFQNIYDPYEWDYYQRVRVRRNRFIRDIAVLGGIFMFMDIVRMLKIGLSKSLREAIVRLESFRHCKKLKVCKSCKFDLICPGLWKSYIEKFGISEVHPVSGPKITEIDYCLRSRFSKYYDQIEK